MSFNFKKVPLPPPREKDSLLANVKRRRRHAQITVLRSLASSRVKAPSEASVFQNTRHMGESHAAPHSVRDQVRQGQQNANVTRHDSHRLATDHSRDGTFRYLSTNFALNQNQ